MLTLDLFLTGIHDIEGTQYRILAKLKEANAAFSRNVIYPYLSRLIKVHDTLVEIVEGFDQTRAAVTGREAQSDDEITAFPEADWTDNQVSALEDLVRWSLPHVQAAIEEGKTVFEFVDQNLLLEEVGIVPSYVEEGYLMVPDRRERALHVLRYELTIFAGPEEKYRALKTTHAKTVLSRQIEPAPTTVKMALIAERRDLPNPATYIFETDLDFPFTETLLPVAKRKLMRYLFQMGKA